MSVRPVPRLFLPTATTLLIAWSLSLLSCEAPYDGVVDVVLQPPVIISASVTPVVIDTDSMNVGPVRLPGDILPITLIAAARTTVSSDCIVRYAIFSDRRLDPLAEGELKDTGIFPDISATDSVFTGEVKFQIQRSFVGDLILELLAQSSRGVTGTSYVRSIVIQRLNQPPVLSNLQVQDTVSTSLQIELVISVQASDPNGSADIVSVTRQTPSNMIYYLNDSGLNGDITAGDGIYTETITLVPPPEPGIYDFLFKAVDRSNAFSNTILHSVVVIP